MISKKLLDAINEQINAEYYSAYLYLSMSAWLEAENLPGFANWMQMQNREETMHATKLYDYILERGGRVQLKAIDAPPTKWDSPLAVFEETLKHERKVTALINDLMNLAIAEKDHPATIFLQWFVSEQVEEESSVETVLQQLKMIQQAPGMVFMMDRELGQRSFTPPADSAD
ncbi:MAG: ferritin [Sedimentisphaerales bacterium]|nr:ferritin [Sedimentisphaerales bacterium]